MNKSKLAVIGLFLAVVLAGSVLAATVVQSGSTLYSVNQVLVGCDNNVVQKLIEDLYLDGDDCMIPGLNSVRIKLIQTGTTSQLLMVGDDIGLEAAVEALRYPHLYPALGSSNETIATRNLSTGLISVVAVEAGVANYTITNVTNITKSYVIFTTLNPNKSFELVGVSGYDTILVENAIGDIMEEGETKEYNINGAHYSINTLIVADTANIVKFKINNTLTSALKRDQAEMLLGDLIIGIDNILPNEAEEVTGGDLVEFYFGVMQVTTITTAETPTPTPTPPPTPAPTPSAPSGGGGRRRIPPQPPLRNVTNITAAEPCLESWVCNAWGACIGGLRARECFEESSCGTELLKPAVEESCQIAPVIVAPPVVQPIPPPPKPIPVEVRKEMPAEEGLNLLWVFILVIAILLVCGVIAVLVYFSFIKKGKSELRQFTRIDRLASLRSYVQKTRAMGYSGTEIRKALSSAGWKPADINAVLPVPKTATPVKTTASARKV